MHTHATQPTLDAMLSPITYESFAAEYWAKAPLRIQRNASHYYRDLLAEPQLDFVLRMAAKIRGAIEILSPDAPRHPRNEAFIIDAVHRGKSVRVNAIQRFVPELSRLQTSLEQDLSCGVNINMYLTPGAGIALGRHYDTHDVFVLQISGSKKWSLFDSPVCDPLEYLPVLRGESRQALKRGRLEKERSGEGCNLTEEFILHSGDLLYLPRGFWHEAQGLADSVSCHLTVGCQVSTFADLLGVIIGQIAEVNGLVRQALPIGFTSRFDCRAAVRRQLGQIVDLLPSIMNSDRALSTIIDLFIRSRQGILESRLLSVPIENEHERITFESSVYIPRGIVIGVETSDAEVILRWRSSSVRLPLIYEAASRYIVRVQQFSPSELPGNLTEAERMTFAATLCSAGLLHLSDRYPSLEPRNSGEMNAWLPIRILEGRSHVRWINVGEAPLSKPFLTQSIADLRANDPKHISKTTRLDSLINFPEEMRPSGFIFHISRCGSTLISNALRGIEGVRVISEPAIVGQVLSPLKDIGFSERRERAERNSLKLLRGIMRSYGQRAMPNSKALVVKLSSWNILFAKLFRTLWPEVPCIVIVRNPIEVMVSCLDGPPGWMRRRSGLKNTDVQLEMQHANIANVSDEEYCARMLGTFMISAESIVDDKCRVVDYSRIDIQMIRSIASHFDIQTTEADGERIARSFEVYSKDSTGTQEFVSDSETKKKRASEAMIASVAQWAQEPYDRLRQGEES
jgi:ribosomal protein L16 Arg81 hydroxylase